MNHLQGTRSKCPRFDFTFTLRRPSRLLHAIFGGGCNAALSLVSSIFIVLSASPANSQLAPDASATAANDRSPVAVSERADIAKEPGKMQPGAVGTDTSNPAPGEAQDEQALRRELAAARAELARQARALKEQRQTDEALTLNLEMAQLVKDRAEDAERDDRAEPAQRGIACLEQWRIEGPFLPADRGDLAISLTQASSPRTGPPGEGLSRSA